MARPSFPPLPPPESIAIGVPSSHPGEPWSHLAGEKGRREETHSKSTPFFPALSFLNVPIPRASLRCHLPVPPFPNISHGRGGGVASLPIRRPPPRRRHGAPSLIVARKCGHNRTETPFFLFSAREQIVCVCVQTWAFSIFYLYPFFSCSIFQPAKQACALPPKTRTKWRRP